MTLLSRGGTLVSTETRAPFALLSGSFFTHDDMFYNNSKDAFLTWVLGLGEIIRADLNLKIKTCTVGIG